MIGIYKYTNLKNNKVYIGQAIDIERRLKQHHYSVFNENAIDYNSQLHQALRKYGEENFKIDVLVEITSEGYSKQILDSLEKEYIKLYQSRTKGYNATDGGDGGVPQKGEKNGRALLTEQDVIYIRECYNAHIPFREVEKEYEKHPISKRGLQKIWYFENWKDILPEYNTKENKYWHSHQAKANATEVARNNVRKFSSEQVIQMRKDHDESGLTPTQIIKKYNYKVATSTIANIIHRKSYKDIK